VRFAVRDALQTALLASATLSSLSTSDSDGTGGAPRPASVATARRFVREKLVAHHLSSLVDDVTLVASELTTNAVKHAGTVFTVTIKALADAVVLTVRDGSAARPVRAGDRIRVRLGPYEHHVTVLALSGRRGPAAEAALLYEESAESREARERLAWQLRHAAPTFDYEKGKPSKKERRDWERWKGD
jgi:ribosomal 50S subunit-recycling heat shock protein